MTARLKSVVSKKPSDFDIGVDQIGKAGALIERVKYETPQQRAAGKKFEGDAIEITNKVIELLSTEAGIFN
jgi:electron transfer flavoprotein alpha/beta subunit